MRTIILMMPVSVGGFIEGPEREFDWHKADELPPPHGLHRKGRRSLQQGGRPLARAPGLLAVVDQTMEPTMASLWRRPPVEGPRTS
jgi:hypothetical protein